MQDTIRIPPETFGSSLEKVGQDQVKMKYEGIVDDKLGYVVAATKVEVSPIGKIIPGDGATYHKVMFSLLTFYPIIQEIVDRGSWVSGNAIVILNRPNTGTAGQDFNYYTYQVDLSKTVEIDITYNQVAAISNKQNIINFDF